MSSIPRREDGWSGGVPRTGDADQMAVVIFRGVVGIDARVPLVFALAQVPGDVAIMFQPHVEIASLPAQVARHIAAAGLLIVLGSLAACHRPAQAWRHVD